jgi:hypothetical protein
VITSPRFITALAIACLTGCGGTQHGVDPTSQPHDLHAPSDSVRTPDPDLDPPPRKHLLAIDWKALKLDTDADALAVWKQIAPTGDDWERKLDEVPGDLPVAHALAVAMLHEGNFVCTTPPVACSKAPPDVPAPADTATLADPCLRRLLAMWSFDQLDAKELPKLRDSLRTIAAIPPPESQLVASALKALPETDVDGRFELLAIAWKAGQRELVNGLTGGLDEAHLTDAVLKLHVDGALEVLSAEAHRPVYMKAVADEQLVPAARISAINELAAATDKLAPDLHAVLVAATKQKDCAVAAAAARALEIHGDPAFVPKRGASAKPDAMLRSLCILASYESLQRADEVSLFASFLPPRGLELARVVYDPYNEVDTDGDGDPHTERTTDLIDRDLAVLPEIDDLIVALRHCTGVTCTSDDHQFKFTFKSQGAGLVLWKLEVVDRPPCKP